MSDILVVPSAGRLMSSLRDIGYDLSAAVADLVDNSLDAAATRIDIDLAHAEEGSCLRVIDDGTGMTPGGLEEAMRYGSAADYGTDALGHFGLGLKTASLSQCRRLTVASRRTARRRVAARRWDLDRILETDEWRLEAPEADELRPEITVPLAGGHGTVVLWERLDRLLGLRDPEGGHARRALERDADRVRAHLGMVFHRFLDGTLESTVRIRVNGEPVAPWDPFARDEPGTRQLAVRRLPLAEDSAAVVDVQGFVLPHQRGFSSADAHDRAAGPLRWNRQQGLYVYRADRLIQSGGWSRLRTMDEHTKLARMSVDIPAGSEAAFGLDVAKMRVGLPESLRGPLREVIGSVTQVAQDEYRRREPEPEVHAPSREPAVASMADVWGVVARVVEGALRDHPDTMDRVLVALANAAPVQAAVAQEGEAAHVSA